MFAFCMVYCYKQRMTIHQISKKNFPELLAQIHDTPQRLNIIGKIPDLPMVAIVGSRLPTDYGKSVTYRLAYDLAKSGLAIVSGLAVGVDSIAHQAALDAGGITVAVLGSGIDVIYPTTNQRLAEQVVNNGGALVSEYPNGTPPLKHHFPMRNRIIAGLSLAVIITEANAKSGALITAHYGLSENRLIMAVPGNITSRRSAGPNNLLKLGAKPATDAVDVLSELGLKSPALAVKKVAADSSEEALLIDLIKKGYSTTDALLQKSQLKAAELASYLSLMEITGKIKNLGAGTWVVP